MAVPEFSPPVPDKPGLLSSAQEKNESQDRLFQCRLDKKTRVLSGSSNSNFRLLSAFVRPLLMKFKICITSEMYKRNSLNPCSAKLFLHRFHCICRQET